LKILTISGVSGSGKTTLQDGLCRQYPQTFHRVVGRTTRPMRSNENDGEHYKFRPKPDAEIASHRHYGGHFYWTQFEDFTSAKEKVNVFVCDLDGVEQLLSCATERDMDLVALWIDLPLSDAVARLYPREYPRNLETFGRRIVEDSRLIVQADAWIRDGFLTTADGTDTVREIRDSTRNLVETFWGVYS
jgi:guanylate kinase